MTVPASSHLLGTVDSFIHSFIRGFQVVDFYVCIWYTAFIFYTFSKTCGGGGCVFVRGTMLLLAAVRERFPDSSVKRYREKSHPWQFFNTKKCIYIYDTRETFFVI